MTSGLGAEEAGLIGLRQDQRGNVMLGDVIVGIENLPVANSDDLLNALEQFQPGETVTVQTLRGNQDEMQFEVELTEPI